MKTISRIITAILNILKGCWKAVAHGGKVTMRWVQDVAAPAIWDTTTDLVDAGARTLSNAAHAIPNTLSRLSPAPRAAVATAPTSKAAETSIEDQRQGRQAMADLQADLDAKRIEALSVRAAARALLRGQEPLGLPEHVRKWLGGFNDDALAIIARMETDNIRKALDGDHDQPLGEFLRSKCDEENPTKPAAVVDRRNEKETSIVDFRAHLVARAAEIAAKRQGMAPAMSRFG